MASRDYFLVLLFSCSLTAPAKSPITHETMWLMKRAAAPAPSPDGRWVVFQVTEPAYDAKDQVSDLWIVPADGGARPRRLTATKGTESGVAWSPDSRRIAFAARREGDEQSQIYVLDVAGGGEAVRFTSLSTGASDPEWSPDGARLLSTSRVYPGAAGDEANKKTAAERKARKYNARVYEYFPIRYWDRWLDDRQAHLFVQRAEPGAAAKDLLAGTRLVSGPGYGGVLDDTGEDLPAVWAPDGRSIVFVATVNRHESARAPVVSHLWQVSAEGGEPSRLTQGENSYRRPAFRPDGQALYAIATKDGPREYYVSRLVMFSWPAVSAPQLLTGDFDRSVESVTFSHDSRRVHFLAEDAGHVKLYTVPAAGGQVTPAFEITSGLYAGLRSSATAPLLVALFESAVNPSEVVRIDIAEKRHRNLSDFNVAKAAEIDWQPIRHFWFTSRRGKRIHNLMVLPPAFDESKKYPLVVFMHGGPHAMSKDQFFQRWNYHLLAQPGYVILMTNYTGSTGFGEKFAQEIQGDPLKGPGEEINEAVDEALKRFPFIDGTRMAAGGASYGGHLANWMQATTTRFRCLFSHAGLINLESQWGTSDSSYHRELNNGGPIWEQGPVWREQNPARYAAKYKTPILLTVGENDFRVPLNQTLENWALLKRLQIPSRLIVFPGENHWIQKGENSRFFYQELHAWLKQHLQ